ncbi:hypothetical protein L3X38_011953 [Prunus dulcis]|uniref:RNase H type-1 domain-containing protein n=1 Tax=Prunus dulcis TaxID=3755 RepID=A0AAD4ZFX2_PRUDU|nr:hypothetical protein L3X38_011953 [Prunus dulcis]
MEDNEIRSLIPSRMKRLSTLDVTSVDQLKVKRRTIIQTRKALNQQNQSDDEEVEILVVHHVTIKELDEEEPFEEEVHDTPAALEDGGQATVDELKELNLGTNEGARPIFISTLLNCSEEESYHQLLLEYKDVFTWTYKEMPGLDPKVAVHHLAVKPGTRPIKQTQRRFRPELLSQIEAEVDKLIAIGFIREVKYITWIANIVPVKKKITGQIRICVDFRDLNEACPKENVARGRRTHSLPHSKRNLLLQGDAIWPQECRLRKYQLKMNPLKCAFGVTSGKFLGFIVKHRGIEVDQTKIKAIRDMPEPRDLRELKSLQGRLAFIRRFISNLAGRCQPFSRLMKKDVPFFWDEACHNAFESVRYVMSKPVLTGRLAKWALLLNQYEIIYTPAKAVKGQAVADFLADHPIPADWEISDDLPDEQVFFADVSPAWMMFFDGSARKDGAGVGVVFVSPERHVLPYSFSLSELCSNNVAEYQALIMGLQMAVEMKISSLEVYGDSMLVINQLLTHFEVRKDDLIPYHQLATQLLESFDFVTLEHMPRKDNQMADALANLAATLALTKKKQ